MGLGRTARQILGRSVLLQYLLNRSILTAVLIKSLDILIKKLCQDHGYDLTYDHLIEVYLRCFFEGK